MRQEIIDYIREAKEAGMQHSEIERRLLEAGWNSTDIEQMRSQEGLEKAPMQRGDAPQSGTHMVSFAVVALFVIASGLVLGGMLAYRQYDMGIIPRPSPPSATGIKQEQTAMPAKPIQVTPIPLTSPSAKFPTLPPEATGTFIQRETCEAMSDTGTRDRCFFELAIGEQNEPLCGTITDTSLQHLCRAGVVTQKNELSRCDEFSNSEIRYNCQTVIYTRLAKNSHDPTFCDHVLEELRAGCLTPIAIDMNDLTICQNMDNQFDRESCITQMAASKKDPQLCERQTTTYASSSCYQSLAIATGNVTLCQKSYLKAKDHRYWCHRQYAVTKAEVNVCDSIPEKVYREDCLREVAAALGDPSICLRIPETSLQARHDCQTSSQRSAEQLQHCRTLPAVVMRDQCFSLLAKLGSQFALCSYLSTSQGVTDCQTRLARPWYFP